MTGSRAGDRRRRLADRLTAHGLLGDPGWRAAVEAVPREAFLGDAVYRQVGSSWEPARRDRMTGEEWLDLAYTDATWVTAVDGRHAADAADALPGDPTSSSTLPSLVVRTLEVSGVRAGMRVLEIGTGTGYSTAILCHHLGDGNVTSVECDPVIAASAARHLHEIGCEPRLVVGDGLLGHPIEGGYDAIVATCSVRYIPHPWLMQLRSGGFITVALGGWMLASGLIRLTVDDDGTASGRFTGDIVSYMLARPHERPPHAQSYRHHGDVRACHTDPSLLDDWTAAFVAQLAAPSAELPNTGDEVVLRDVATGSQAWTEPTSTGWQVHQHGPLRLWDQVEDALLAWQAAGAPAQHEFVMRIGPDMHQTVHLPGLNAPHWSLPT